MSTAENPEQVKAVQENWDQREFVEVVSIHILQVTEFLNNFGKRNEPIERPPPRPSRR